MEELVKVEKNDCFTDSMVIADSTGNQHKSVIALIKKHSKSLEKFGVLRFIDLKSTNSKGGRPIKICQLNEQQATLLISFLDNNEVVVEFKTKLVDQFYRMRTMLMQRNTEVWIEQRKQGKITRKKETDVIQRLVEYAKEQGSKHSQMLYMTYSKLANKMAGISDRDLATWKQLSELSFIENIILNQIRVGMEREMDYHDIYKDCKKQIELFKDVAYLE